MATVTTFVFKRTLDLIHKADPAVLNRHWPSPAIGKEYETAHKMAKQLFLRLQNMDAKPVAIDDATYIDIERAAKALRHVAQQVDVGTEVGSRSTTYEAVLLYASGYAERAIFLAGVADQRGLREPFGTQLRCLPADSCILRFRQLHNVREHLMTGRYGQESDIQQLAEMLRQMQQSLASQFMLFSEEAYSKNGTHPWAAYLKSLSLLLRSFMVGDGTGRNRDAKALQEHANQVISDLREPTEDLHVAEIKYHELNYEEFKTFKRLSRSQPDITSRLKQLHARSIEIQDANRGRNPQLSYPITPWVVGGLRCASVLGIASLIAALATVGADDFRACADEVWKSLGNSVDGVLASHGPAVAMGSHGGGMASIADSLGQFVLAGKSHGGGMI